MWCQYNGVKDLLSLKSGIINSNPVKMYLFKVNNNSNNNNNNNKH